jgi:murein L,D-transpeptidase YafK
MAVNERPGMPQGLKNGTQIKTIDGLVRTLPRAGVAGRRTAALALAAALVATAGCAGLQNRWAPAPPPAQSRIDAESRIERFQLALVIHKSRQTLSVYRHGTVVERYPATLGQQATGDKLFEGDLRTPEGLYQITGKHNHARWKYFLQMDYPNDRDLERYRTNLRNGRIPIIRSKPLPIGSGIGIHGSDRVGERAEGQNWTRGCIALTNADVAEIHRLVKIGTPVLVLP